MGPATCVSTLRVFFSVLVADLDLTGNIVPDRPVDLESAEEIRHDLHEKHWPVSTLTSLPRGRNDH
jgi:hypothetical protein